MISMNFILLAGNLTRDPEMRYLPSGTPVARLALAVNTMVRRGDSRESTQETCYVDAVVFGKSAELCSQRLAKGSPVVIEGRLQYRT
jgi:single-strand DNA-binding protein